MDRLTDYAIGSGQNVFEVDLHGWGSRVRMNGVELDGIRDVKVHQPLEGSATVTIEFLAAQVKGFPEGEKALRQAVAEVRNELKRQGVDVG